MKSEKLVAEFVIHVEVNPDPDLHCFKCSCNRDGVSLKDPILMMRDLFTGASERYICNNCALNNNDAPELRTGALASFDTFKNNKGIGWIPSLSVEWFNLNGEWQDIPDMVMPEEADHA